MDNRRSRSQATRKSKSPARKVPSKIYPNPFLNFLSDFRKSNKQKLSCVEMTKRGAQLWRGMSAREKSPYRNISKQAPKYKIKRSRSRKKRRGKRRGRKRRRRSRGKRSRERRRRRRTRSYSSSHTETDTSVDRRHGKERRSDKNKKETRHEKNEEPIPKRSDRDMKDQKPGHSKSDKDHENRTEDDEDDLRYKSADYDDIRRDYI